MINFLAKNKDNLVIYCLTILTIASIGIEPAFLLSIIESTSDTNYTFYEDNEFLKLQILTLINLVRGISPFIVIITIIFLLIMENKKFSMIINPPLLIFLLYNIFQIIGYFLVGESELLQRHFVSYDLINNFKTLYLAIQSLALVFLLIYINAKDQIFFENYIKFLIFIIFLIYSYFLILNLNHYFFISPNYNMYASDYNVNHQI